MATSSAVSGGRIPTFREKVDPDGHGPVGPRCESWLTPHANHVRDPGQHVDDQGDANPGGPPRRVHGELEGPFQELAEQVHERAEHLVRPGQVALERLVDTGQRNEQQNTETDSPHERDVLDEMHQEKEQVEHGDSFSSSGRIDEQKMISQISKKVNITN